MEDKCGEIVDMSEEDADSVRLHLTKSERYGQNMDCVLRLMAPENKRLVIKVDTLNVQWEQDCGADFLQMFDGTSLNGVVVEGKDVGMKELEA